MILYTLRCAKNHEFEAWFKDSAAYDAQLAATRVVCPACGSAKVEKAIMAPRLGKKKGARPASNDAPAAAKTVSVDPRAVAIREQLRALRREVEGNCDYVGPRFAEEARKIHYGETEARGIYGETSDEEAKELSEEGVGFARVPWISSEDA
jgi:hypothetical protein